MEYVAIDPHHVLDTFCEGVSAITKIGDCLRFTLVASRECEGELEHVIVAQIIWPRAALQTALYQAQMALEGSPFLSAYTPPIAPN